MTDWILKTTALLHDSPNKVLNLKSHEREAFRVIEEIVDSAEFEARFGFKASEVTSNREWKAQVQKLERGNKPWQFLKLADQIASAIDRAAYPDSVRLFSRDYASNPLLKHPFSGAELKLPTVVQSCQNAAGEFDEGVALRAQLDALSRVKDLLSALTLDTPQKKYLALWRMLPHLADHEHSLLPPDTRMVDHTLWAHLDVTSALVSSLPGVAMLQMSVGPVQTFIFEARRTQDLWMGSYLLSYLAWEGIKVIVEAYGPDAVIYPSLRGHPWLDRWLQKELGESLPPSVFPGDITAASTPNKFVALVPAQGVESIANKIADRIRGTWRKIAEAVHQDFPGDPRAGIWQEIWQRQVEREDWPQIYWSAVCWPSVNLYPQEQGADEALRRVEACL